MDVRYSSGLFRGKYGQVAIPPPVLHHVRATRCPICDGSGLTRPHPQPENGAEVEDRVGASQSGSIEQARATGNVGSGSVEWRVRLEGDLEGPRALTDPSTDSEQRRGGFGQGWGDDEVMVAGAKPPCGGA
eukprot:609417-Rhodomonas_salina.2